MVNREQTHMQTIKLDGNSLTLEQIEDVARRGAPVALTAKSIEKMRASRKLIDDIVETGQVVYGVNTGFGILSDVTINRKQIEKLQENLIRSHSIGVGNPLPTDAVRAIMLLRANVLAKGFSGIRIETVQTLLDMLNAGVHPQIPEKGSVGASGDLAPLAHLALVLLGRGHAEYKGRVMSGKAALKAAGIAPIVLQAKEGLALINGTQVMTGIGALALLDGERAARVADIVGAMTVEALLASTKPFDPRIQDVRPHPGQKASAANLRKLLRGSPIVKSHKGCGKVQDAYSLRCIPQVHGATRDALTYIRGVLSIEANSATDNPLVFADDNLVVSGGNFHGQPVAIALDLGAIALAELANISERRVEQLVNPVLSSGLPAFLVSQKGLNSGYMIAQVTSASLVSENKILAHPASVDSIPSSAGREDHVSMGTISSRKMAEVLRNVEEALAVELLCAAQAIDFRAPLKPAKATAAVHDLIRKEVPFLDHDRTLYLDQKKVLALLRSGDIVRAASDAIGDLA
jgi:histidine ammonia-lyase